MNPSSQGNETRYWLMVGEIPTGPFTTTEILTQIQSGTCNWLTKACAVGGVNWMPLNQVLTLAPVAQHAVPLAANTSLVSKVTVVVTRIQALLSAWATRRNLALFIGFVVVCLVGYWIYSSIFPTPVLTPQQVCQQLLSSKTVQEAKVYVTLNMHNALNVLYAQPDTGQYDQYEFTSEHPAPPGVGGYYVGFREHGRDGTTLVVLEGIFHVVSQDGWKVNDMIMLGWNGQNFDPPVSLAREYYLFQDPQHPAAAANRNLTPAQVQAKQWYNDPATKGALQQLGRIAALNPGTGKAIGALFTVVGVGFLALFGKRFITKSSDASKG